MKGKKMIDKIMECVNKLVLLFVAQTANSACIWVMYQPEFPEEARKFHKTKVDK